MATFRPIDAVRNLLRDRTRGLPSGFCTAALALICCLAVPAGRAMAQGTGGAFPDPIAIRDVERAAERLGADAAQRVELEALHDRYRAEMRELRESRIEEYLRDSAGAPRRTREEVEASVVERRRLLEQIERVERRFFEGVASVLRPEQGLILESIRERARRDRLRGVLDAPAAQAVSFELRDAVSAIELDEALSSAIAPRIEAHERRVTRQLAELAALAVSQPLATADAVALADLRAPSRAPSTEEGDEWRDEMEAFMRERARIRAEAAAPQRAKRREIAMANLAAVEAIGAELPEAARWRLFDRFVRETWPELASDGAVDRIFDTARTQRSAEDEAELNAEELEAISEAHRAARAELRRLVLESVAAGAAADDDGGFSVIRLGHESFERRQARLDALRTARAAIAERAREDLAAILGAERAERFAARQSGARRGAEGGGGSGGVEVRRAAVSVMVIAAEDGAVGDGEPIIFESSEILPLDAAGGIAIGGAAQRLGMGGAGPLPRPIDRERMRRLAIELGLDGAERSIIEMLDEDYRTEYAALRDQELEMLRSLGVGVAMAAGIGPGGAAIPTSDQVERGPLAMRHAAQRLAQVDERLFDDLEALYGDGRRGERIRSVRELRRRELLRAEATAPGALVPMFGFDASREADLDLAVVVDAIGLDEPAQAAVEGLLVRYDEQALAMLRRRADIKLDAQREIDRFHASALSIDGEGRVEFSASSDTSGFDRMARAQERIAEASRAGAELNRAMAAEIAAALPEEPRERLRRAYNRAAWPSVYVDRHDASSRIEAALALPDLDEPIRTALAALAAEHDRAYEALCDRMVEHHRAGSPSASGSADRGAGDIRAMQARQNELQKLRFERSEMNAASLRRLASLLDDSQRERIGGIELPRPQERPTIRFGAP
ncbi:MAG TPA: hypothetical protein PKC43_02195 [Phycisphaerales bacterium]|nr:hypothetical protein [Phycisphaerales bacterium]HMP36236.1 hypothetical protein [Phycisphaerales bacterium]